MLLYNFLWVALGGALGASARYAVSIMLAALSPMTTSLIPTLCVNVIGSFLMGSTAMGLMRGSFSPDLSDSLRLLLMVGVLGGFTTFSAVSYELFILIERRDYWIALAYASGSVILALLGFICGAALIRSL